MTGNGHSTAKRLPERDFRDISGLIIICMDCRRVRHTSPAGERWLAMEELPTKLPEGISHGLCSDCLEERVQNYRAASVLRAG
jgi:hypothetical protein